MRKTEDLGSSIFLTDITSAALEETAAESLDSSYEVAKREEGTLGSGSARKVHARNVGATLSRKIGKKTAIVANSANGAPVKSS